VFSFLTKQYISLALVIIRMELQQLILMVIIELILLSRTMDQAISAFFLIMAMAHLQIK